MAPCLAQSEASVIQSCYNCVAVVPKLPFHQKQKPTRPRSMPPFVSGITVLICGQEPWLGDEKTNPLKQMNSRHKSPTTPSNLSS